MTCLARNTTNASQCYHFALKTFEEGNAGPYENEKKAFQALRKNDGMVRYLGEYIHKEVHESSTKASTVPEIVTPDSQEDETRVTYNILLEFGEFDLEEYLHDVLPPVVQTEVEAFWKGLFEVADAVKGVHNLQTNTDGRVQEYYGWHADIKPDNILIVQGKFKLADPGFATFVKKTDGNALARLCGGTETYGAPERHPGRRESLSAVPQTIDTWSLGCVFSIAATWVVLGYEGIRQFSRLREKAIMKIGPTTGANEKSVGQEKSAIATDDMGDYFHDSQCVLNDVLDWHEMLRHSLRHTDTITKRVLDLVDQKMLVDDASRRLSAEKTCEALREILIESRGGPRKQIPPNIMAALKKVDEEDTIKSPESFEVEKADSKAHGKGKGQSLTIQDQRKARKSKLNGEPFKKTTHRSEYRRSAMAAQNAMRGSSRSGRVPDVPKLPASATTAQPSQVPNPTPTATILPTRPQLVHDIQVTNTTYPARLPTDSSGSTPTRHKMQQQSRIKNGRKHQNVFQAREEIEMREKGIIHAFRKVRRTVKDPLLADHYKNRDIVSDNCRYKLNSFVLTAMKKFLVDNAESMEDFWYEAKFLLETLLKKAQGLDENGMDLMFTIGSYDVENQKGTSRIMTQMDNMKARPKKGMHTDMRGSLGNIFDKYITDARRKKQYNSDIKNLTLIVLTDGKWEGTKNKEEVNRKIVYFSRELEGIIGNLKDRPVSIEFIQFGYDEDATYRLKALDNDLKYSGIRYVFELLDEKHSD